MKTQLQKYPIPLKKDPLDFVIRFHQILYSHKFWSPIIYGGCVFYAFIAVVSSIHLSMIEGIGFLKKYSIVPSTMPWAFTTAIAEYYWIQPGFQSSEIHMKKHWDESTASSQLEEKIREQTKIARVTCSLFIFQSIINSIVGFFIGIFGDIRSDMHSIDIMFKDYFFIKIFLYIVSNISHSVVTLTSISLYIGLKYFSTLTKIQLQLLTDFLESVEVYRRTEDKAISEHLKICCAHHSHLLDQFKRLQRMIMLPLIPCSAGGSLAILGCLICIYSNRQITNAAYILLLLSLVGMISLDCCQIGQDLEDAFEDFSMNLTKVKWYEWNAENKKILIIMLMRSQKSAQIKVLNLSFNKTLLIQIMKAAYQIFILLKSRI